MEKLSLDQVRISPDGLTAYSVVHPGTCFEDLLFSLVNSGIVHGIDLNLLKNNIDSIRKISEIIVAKGTPPGKSADTIIEWLIKDPGLKINYDENGTVDFYDFEIFSFVNKNQEIAIIHPPAEGSEGISVRGEVIPAVPPRIEKILLKGACIKDGNTVKATSDGVIRKKVNVVDVVPVLFIDSDVDLKTGNINAIIPVKISGWVRSGFKLKSTEDILISGGVEEKTIIESAQNISIKLGILGNDTSKVSCKGNLTAKFIQGAVIEVEGNVYVNEYIMNSDVTCKGSVYINGKRGELINSNTSAEISVIVKKYRGSGTSSLKVKGFDRAQFLGQIKELFIKRNQAMIELRKLTLLIRNKQKEKDPYLLEYIDKYKNLDVFLSSLEQEINSIREVLEKVEGEGMIKVLSDTDQITFQIKGVSCSHENLGTSTFFYDPKEKKVIKKWPA